MASPERPLAGLMVVITRPREQSAGLAGLLEQSGARVIELPAIEILPARDYAPLDAAIKELSGYDWLIFTSANGVRFFLERLERCAMQPADFRGRVCAIGPATRRAAVAAGFQVDLVPEQYVAESLVAAFKDFDLQNKRILLPRAAIARDLVPDELRRLGARVDVVEAYRTGLPPGVQERAAKIFAAGRKPDWITFTSSSTVNNFIAAAGREALAGVRVASIGPVTSATLRSHGVEVTAEAAAYTAEGLVEAIISSR